MARDGTITEVANGTTDFKRILGQSALAGMVCWFVEHDDPRDPMRSIETSLRFVQRLDIQAGARSAVAAPVTRFPDLQAIHRTARRVGHSGWFSAPAPLPAGGFLTGFRPRR